MASPSSHRTRHCQGAVEKPHGHHAAMSMQALNYLHRGGGGAACFHRDVKAANIVLKANLTAKLIDCGLATLIETDDVAAGRTKFTVTGGALGTTGYMCSRYCQDGKFGAKSELFSYGVVLLELIVGEVTNQRRNLYQTFIEDEDEEIDKNKIH